MAETETTSQGNEVPPISVRISEDYMCAFVRVEPWKNGEPPETEAVARALREAGVKQGILMDQMDTLLCKENYYSEVVVAEGKAAVDGTDGAFILNFKTEPPGKPMELPDGTVDYTNMELFVPVIKEQLLAKYEPATAGMFGYTVTGQLLTPKKGKDLPPLRGKGFRVTEDSLEYYALFDGRVEYGSGTLEISRVFVVKGNLDMTVGNLVFTGDIEVYGDVSQGMRIEAGGTVIIGGHVSSATIIAGEDVVLKGGMQGDTIGKITANGNITAKFLEAATIVCKGNLTANYVLNCKLSAEGRVEISGRKGVILGGHTFALLGIKAAELGNQAFLPTVLSVGASEELNQRVMELKRRLRKVDDELAILFRGKVQIEEAVAQSKENKHQELYDKVLQAISLKNCERERYLTEDRSLSELVAVAQKARIMSTGTVYPGVRVTMLNQNYAVKDAFRNVSFAMVEDELVVVQNS